MALYENLKLISNIVPAVIGVAVAGITFSSVFTSIFDDFSGAKLDTVLEKPPVIDTTPVISLENYESLKNEIAAIQAALTNNAAPGDTEVRIRISEIEEKVNKSLEIVKLIEKSIVDNPERAMSIPMLRKDFDTVKSTIQSQNSSFRTEIDRMYDLGKWFIGLMGTMAVGVLGLAVGNILKSKDS